MPGDEDARFLSAALLVELGMGAVQSRCDSRRPKGAAPGSSLRPRQRSWAAGTTYFARVAPAMPMRITHANDLPRAGHYSNAVEAGGFLFISGQGPWDPATGRVIDGDARAKAVRCLRNVEAVLHRAGATLDGVVKTTAFLERWSDYDALNAAYAEVFPASPPARATLQGTRPPGHLVTIEAVALAPRRS